MRRRIFQICPAVFVLVLLSPRYGLAQWVTWHQFGTQGSYVHQIAHLLFFLSMLFFIHEIIHANLQKFRGFRLLVWAWALFALWNLDAFVGHWAAWTLWTIRSSWARAGAGGSSCIISTPGWSILPSSTTPSF